MTPFRRFLLVLLNPRPPVWAHAGGWCIGGVGLIVASRMIDRRGTIAGLGDVMEFLGFGIILLACVASILRRAQVDWHTKQLIKRGAGLCPNCGYNLKGLPTRQCPECGTDIEAATREAAQIIKPDV